MNFVARFCLCLCLIGSAVAGETWVVREDGVGPVKIGMTLSQLNIALRERFVMPADNSDQGCFYVNPKRHPQISFMIENGSFVRTDVESAGAATLEGIQVGDSESRALEIYGSRLKVDAHAYTGPEGHYLTARSKDGRFGIRFETDQGKITTFYSGRYEAIQYIEGCQ